MFGQLDNSPEPSLDKPTAGRPTLGGKQYWTDQLICNGWRIQQHVRFGQHRLLKPSNRAVKAGDYAACRQAFDQLFDDRRFAIHAPQVVVTLHGLGRTRNSMAPIGEFVSESGNFGWLNFGYASTRSTIAEHSQALRHVLDEFALLHGQRSAGGDGASGDVSDLQFHFIAHSLGNIVVRHMLNTAEKVEQGNPKPAWQLGRIVMLGPPNQGSAMANLLKNNLAFRMISGAPGRNLGAQWNELEQQLATPQVEFAIIAGGKNDGKGYNPLLAGDDDLIVRVAETHLAGVADFAVIPSIHSKLMQRRQAQEMALRFLQTGSLKAPVQSTPLP